MPGAEPYGVEEASAGVVGDLMKISGVLLNDIGASGGGGGGLGDFRNFWGMMLSLNGDEGEPGLKLEGMQKSERGGGRASVGRGGGRLVG